MSFSYSAGSNPTIDYPRMLIGDTVDAGHIFEDSEILAAHTMTAAVFQSGMGSTPPGGNLSLPSQPVSYLRVAALLLDALASSKARVAVTKLLDANVDFAKTSAALHAQAQAWREVDDNSGAFAIIEQASNNFSFVSRFYKEIQRSSAQ